MDEQSNKSNKITDYFTFKKTVEWVDIPIVQTTTDHFYSDSILERVDEMKCIGHHCVNKKLELMNRLKEEKEKLVNLEKALSSCEFIIGEKNKKIAQLHKKATTHVPNNLKTPQSTPKTTPTSKSTFRTPTSSPTTTFASFGQYFSTQQLAQLRSFDREMRDDSKFILSVMRSLYEHNLNELKGINEFHSKFNAQLITILIHSIDS